MEGFSPFSSFPLPSFLDHLKAGWNVKHDTQGNDFLFYHAEHHFSQKMAQLELFVCSYLDAGFCHLARIVGTHGKLSEWIIFPTTEAGVGLF